MPGSHTRSGKEFSGLSKAQTTKLFSTVETVELTGFNLSSILKPAEELQSKIQSIDSDPPLQHYCFRPRLSSRSYTPISIADLAQFRAKAHPACTTRVRKATSSHFESNASMLKKRSSERLRRANKRLAEQQRIGTNIKAYQRRHVCATVSTATSINFKVADPIYDGPTWTGDRDNQGEDGEKKPRTFAEARAVPGMKVFKWDGGRNVLFHDGEGHPVILLAQRASDQESKELAKLFEEALQSLNLEGTEHWHRRGQYFALMFGISFGGGQQRPGNFLHNQRERKLFERLRSCEVLKTIAHRMDFLLACYFPQLHNLYSNVLSDLISNDPRLSRNWDGCSFAASSFNFNSAVTVSHQDYLNLSFGTCAIYSAGDFDYKQGGHLILWDLKLIIEFPPGCAIFIPSALLRHANTSIQPGETRHSLTFFSASGLFRWRHNNFMSDKDFTAGASREEHKENLWKTGLDLLRDMLI